MGGAGVPRLGLGLALVAGLELGQIALVAAADRTLVGLGAVGIEVAASRKTGHRGAILVRRIAAALLVDVKAVLARRQTLQVWGHRQAALAVAERDGAARFADAALADQVHLDGDPLGVRRDNRRP